MSTDIKAAIDRVVLNLDAQGVIRSLAGDAVDGLTEAVGAGQSLLDLLPPSERSFVSANLRWISEDDEGSEGRIAFRLARPNRGWQRVVAVLRKDGANISATLEADDIREARRAEAQMRQVVEGSRQGIVVRTNTELLYCNDAFANLLGYESRGEMFCLDRSALDQMIYPDDRPIVLERIRARLSGQEAISHYEMRLIHRSGKLVWVAVAASSVVWDGKPASLSWLSDIDDRKRVESELVESKDAAEFANRCKSDFLAQMSHELRTPLNAIIGYSEVLLEDAEEQSDGQLVADLRRINGAGKHLLSLVSDVLDLSKIEAGRMELSPTRFDLRGLIDDVVLSCRPQVEHNCNRFEVQVDPSVGHVTADAAKLRQVILNLLSNAGKFTRDGTVTMEVARQRRDGADWIVVTVRDTGIGMDPATVSRLFSNFTQANAATASKFGGTGIGLALSRKLCHLMRGDITVESAIGAGSYFVASVPTQIADDDCDDCIALTMRSPVFA